MGRRRWRFVTIAAFLLFIIKDTNSQDENDFFYAPVERNFAQVQPPLFPSNRQSTFYEQDNYRVAPTIQQPYTDGHVRFPSPNYNQNPQPFQLPTGRSQNGAQYYVNQPEFPAPQRQRFRPLQPFNYQLQQATTRRPDLTQIHSQAYQNDPSKPETFLGQITLNNPDIDYLQNSRFKNIPFDGNSLKINSQSGHILHDEDIDNQDLFDQPKVTTYNPNKNNNRLRLSLKSNSRYNKPVDDAVVTENAPDKVYGQKSKPKLANSNKNNYNSASTEYKELLDIEPLLEDDISDISSFRELMKNNQGSFDVQVIKSNNSNNSALEEDSKPDATSINADNMLKDTNVESSNKQTSNTIPRLTMTTTTTESIVSHEEQNSHEDTENEEVGEEEYVEYYDENESTENKHTTTSKPRPSEPVTDIYDDYDSTEELESTTEEIKTNTTETFDVLVMKTNKTLVKDDNFKQFVDTTIIDQTEPTLSNESSEISTSSPVSYEDVLSVEKPSILGQEVVSVVTTKSVVNGTISVPDVNYVTTTKINALLNNISVIDNNSSSIPTTTENWVVVASVQTSRSVSGARFLPFPAVEQEEKKQLLDNDKEEGEDDEDNVTQDPLQNSNVSISSSSTENINDKLDSIQSELSSAVLSGSLNNENKNIELLTETTTEAPANVTSTTTTAGPLNVFTLKSIVSTLEKTEKTAPDPLPVMIKKFSPRVTTTSTSTTQRPKKKPSLVTVMDDIAGLLPPGYKSKLSYKDKRTSTTSTTTATTKKITTTTTSTTTVPILSASSVNIFSNSTQARSSGINSKNRVIVLDDKSLLPKEYRPKENKSQDDLFKILPKDNLSQFLPPGYKLPITEEPVKNVADTKDIIEKVQKVDITSFLPKGFKLNETSPTESETKPSTKFPVNAIPVDITALLPPGFKLNETSSESTENKKNPQIKFKVADISNLLPSDFKLNTTESVETSSSSTTSAPSGQGFKVVFPSRPGGKMSRKTTARPNSSSGPPPVTFKIQKGWPTRASTEFTGWPSVSTTPFSFDKLLETIKSTSPLPHEEIPEITTRRTTTTTTTTTPKPTEPTTPGICREHCDIAATIKIVSGAKWVPELLDHHTEEWQNLAKEIKTELNSVYSKSDLLKKWYKGIRIDSFSEGSVLVDYIIELNEVEDKVDTLALKNMFHKSLHEARPGSVIDRVVEESDEFDPDIMQGDQPEEDRMKKSNEKMTKTIDKSAGKLEIGKFVMDPAYTEFIVLPKREEPKIVETDEEAFLPQWGIAVIVIALASLLFVVIFGVTVLVNRQKSTKAKQPIPLSEDMLRELDKSHMGGFDDIHQMKERDLPYLPSGKRMSTAFIEQLAYSNPGDSWRSEWTPQMQKYMQYYTPDSGRGSQIYGQTGNQYGYGGGGGGGSQIYGQSGGGGGGSQVYGYTGEYLRAQHPRRRSDYDSNF